jgi:nicotinamidase-related amidase
MNTALILVDIQNDYFPNGKMELEGSLEAGHKAGELLAFFRRAQLPLVHIQHIAVKPGATFFLPDTEGVQTHESVMPLPGEQVIRKNFPNSFRNTPLLETLQEQQIKRLVIAGMMTHMCIDATTRAATDLGFECWLAHDACATRALSFQNKAIPAEAVHGAFMAALNGTYAKVMTAGEILAALGEEHK